MKKLSYLVLGLFSFLMMAAPILAAKDLSIERIFSDPRLEGVSPVKVQWAPDGSQFAFLWNDSGRKTLSLWLYHLKTGKLQEIILAADLERESVRMPEEEKRRQETMRVSGSGITDFSWSPDGRKILLPYHSDICLYDLESSRLLRITKTDEAEFDSKFCGSPERICFVKNNDLWLMDVGKGQTVQLTNTGNERLMNGLSNYIALEELGRYSSFECSEDGKSVAYVQSDLSQVRKLIIPDYLPRYVEYETQDRPVAGEGNAVERVGVVPASGGETRWVDIPLTDYYVVSLHWREAELYLRILERNNKILHLFSFDTAAGSLTEILREEDDRWVNIHNNFIRFTQEPRGFLWTAERDGFNHLYFYEDASKTLRKVTEGTWEVTEIFGMDAKGRVYYVSTGVEPQQQHLFSVDLGNGKIKRVTEEEGWHNIKLTEDFQHFVDIHSSDRFPSRMHLVSTAKPRERIGILDTASPELSDYDLPVLKFFKVKSRDGEEISCSIMKPKDLQKRKKYPVIVHVHGGGYAQSVAKQWRGIWHLFHAYLAQELKFIVVDVDYRGSSGYGRKCRTDVHLNLGGKDLEDVIDVVEWLKKQDEVDPERLGIWGWSYGGFLTNMAMLKTPEVFKAGVAVGPVNDWKNYDTQYTEERLTIPLEAPEAYRVSSPVTYAANLKNHLLVIHGMRDDNVHFQDTVQLINEFIRNKSDFDMMIYPEGRHGISGDASRIHLFSKIASYFQRHLK